MLSVLMMLLCHAMVFSLRVGLPTGSFPRPLTKEEEADYLARAAEGDLDARNKLVEHNLRLVAHMVKKYYVPSDSQEDLISIGAIGLIKAVNTFRPDKNIRLATYAARCIENATLSQMRLWFRTNPPRAEKNQNGVFWHRLQRIYTSFAPLRMVM